MDAPPPDFRYVGLEPGPSAKCRALFGPGAGAACALGAALSGADTLFVAAAAAFGVGASVLFLRRRGPVLPGPSRPAPMAIVPWGVLVRSEGTWRMLRWAAVRSVSVEFVHETDQDTPSTRWSMVTIETDRERLWGRAFGGVGLERLEAHVASYAEEAARCAAMDLDGARVAADPLEPSFEQLSSEARRLIRSGELSERFRLPPASYRDARALAAAPETAQALAGVLRSPVRTSADPRPLATVLVGELGLSELRARVAELTTSPHPLLAATARAAALRLGGDVKRVGAIDEVADFLPPSDVEQLQRWARAATAR